MKAILLNRILLVLSFIGLFLAGVLSMEAGLNLEVPCGASRGCAIVAKDPSSKIAGIPVAYIGLVGYLLLAGLAVMRALSPTRDWRRLVNVGYVAAVVGAGVSLWLQYKSLFVIHATCLWCFSSAVDMVLTLIVYALLAQEMENLGAKERYKPEPQQDEPEGTPEPPHRAMPVDSRLIVALPVALGIGLVLMGLNMSNNIGAPVVGPNVTVQNLIPNDPTLHSMGDVSAPLTLVEFADLCCPSCKRVSPKVEEYVKDHPGKIRLIYRHYPLPMHDQSMTAAAISEVAADDKVFWQYVLSVMSLPEEPKSADELVEIARTNGVNEDDLRKRIKNSDDPIYSRLGRDLKAVKALGINSTPTFFSISKGKVLEVLGPNQIMEALESPKYQKLMGGNGA